MPLHGEVETSKAVNIDSTESIEHHFHFKKSWNTNILRLNQIRTFSLKPSVADASQSLSMKQGSRSSLVHLTEAFKIYSIELSSDTNCNQCVWPKASVVRVNFDCTRFDRTPVNDQAP